MTPFEKFVTESITDIKECNSRIEEANENIKEDVSAVVKKLNGVDIHKLRDDVEKHGNKLWYLTGVGAVLVIVVPIILYLMENF